LREFWVSIRKAHHVFESTRFRRGFQGVSSIVRDAIEIGTASKGATISERAWAERSPARGAPGVLAALRESAELFVHLLSPFAPHLAEQIWATLSASGFLLSRPWPAVDAVAAREDEASCATLHCATEEAAGPRSGADGSIEGSGGSGGSISARSDPVCDGTDDVRFMISQGGSGGGLPWEIGFTNPYGSDFAFVDGHCRFVTGSRNDRGYHEGTLEADQALELSNESAWRSLPELNGYEGPQCADCPTAIVSDGAHRMTWHDTISPDPHEEQRTIFGWFQRFRTLGQESTGPVRVLAVPWDPPDGTALQDWPLAVDPATLGSDAGYTASSGVRFDDPADTAALRALRAKSVFNPPDSLMTVPIRTAGPAYRVSIRDELPDQMAAGIDAFWEALWR
jgi:hypothetical protein